MDTVLLATYSLAPQCSEAISACWQWRGGCAVRGALLGWRAGGMLSPLRAGGCEPPLSMCTHLCAHLRFIMLPSALQLAGGALQLVLAAWGEQERSTLTRRLGPKARLHRVLAAGAAWCPVPERQLARHRPHLPTPPPQPPGQGYRALQRPGRGEKQDVQCRGQGAAPRARRNVRKSDASRPPPPQHRFQHRRPPCFLLQAPNAPA